jgi:Flp pilus assembly pilin Flp
MRHRNPDARRRTWITNLSAGRHRWRRSRGDRARRRPDAPGIRRTSETVILATILQCPERPVPSETGGGDAAMRVKQLAGRVARTERGQDLIEYAVLATFVSLVAIAGATMLGRVLGPWYDRIENRVVAAEPSTSSTR